MQTDSANHDRVQVGDAFVRWTVIGPPFPQSRRTDGIDEWFVPCRCSCGNARAVRVTALFNGHSKSCGCERPGPHDEAGRNRTRLYRILHAMKSRCYNTNNGMYARYGGRGISICKEWRDSFISFRDWANANGYSPDFQIDRIDNDGNYEPNNCRWISDSQNKRNTSQNRFVTAFGETRCLMDWINDERCSMSFGGLKARLNKGWKPEDAISTPPLSHKDRGRNFHKLNSRPKGY